MFNELTQFLPEMEEGTLSKMDEFPTRELAFTAYVLEEIAEKININDYHVANLIVRNAAGANLGEIHGYAFNENGETLSLFYTVYDSYSRGQVQSMRSGDYQLAISRMQGFYLASIKGGHMDVKNNPALFDAMRDIYDNYHKVTSIYLRVVSNYMVSSQDIKKQRIDDKTLYPDAWDLKKIYTNLHSGLDHVAIDVNFDNEEYSEFEIPFIEMASQDYDYKCILALFPAKLLYKLYDKHNIGLLLNNVRYFLGFKGSNKTNANPGMLKTLREDHEMFLAYNNGITAVANNVIARKSSNLSTKQQISTGILQNILDFRIVNGGQTTAVLFRSKKDDRENKINIDGVFVQVKIIILPTESSEKISNITRFSNSQTKIKYADFTVSNAYNQSMEKLSRTLPAPNNNNCSVYWFYERVRGQYDNMKNRTRNKAEQQYFLSMYPKDKKFKKEHLAKIWTCWEQKPSDACQGEGRCYDNFMKPLVDNGYIPDEKYYQESIALLIIYNKLSNYAKERRYGSAKSGIIAYTMAYLNYVTFNRLDLRKIWDNQSLSSGLEKYVESLSSWILRAARELSSEEEVVKFFKQTTAFEKIKKYNISMPLAMINDDLIK